MTLWKDNQLHIFCFTTDKRKKILFAKKTHVDRAAPFMPFPQIYHHTSTHVSDFTKLVRIIPNEHKD